MDREGVTVEYLARSIEDPASVPWLCAALVFGVALLAFIGRRG